MKTPGEFWAKVAVGGEDECWEWQGGVTSAGYGSLAWNGRGSVAHRVSAFLSGLVDGVSAPKDRKAPGFVLHRCDNRRCCNPKHFFIGTYSQNMFDMYEKGRHAVYRGSTHTNAKLSTGQVAFVRALYSTGEWRQIDLAALVGVSQRVISMIVRKESYV